MDTLTPDERRTIDRAIFEQSWETWLTALYPRTMYDFGAHHRELWDWVWAMPEEAPEAFIGIWPRGGAKSTNAELTCVMLGCLGRRRYTLYICGTQEQADDHVANVAALLDHATLSEMYPGMSEPLLNKMGDRKGWRRNRLRTASGFTIDALGLDTAARGVKVDDDRPDYMVIDDIDTETDSIGVTDKKILQLSRKLLPAGAWNCAILGVQNLVHENSIFSRLAGLSEERIDILQDRIVSGPFPALYDAAFEEDAEGKWHVIAGTPLWSGQNLDTCDRLLRKIGYTAFLVECQQQVSALPGGMFDHLSYRHCTWQDLPGIMRVAVWCDPAVTSTDKSDRQAIQVDGLGTDNKIYRFYSWEKRTSPTVAIMRALRLCLQFKCSVLGIETDQGGETWQSVYTEAQRNLWEGWIDPDTEEIYPGNENAFHVTLVEQKASGIGNGSKLFRAQQMLMAYEQGKFVHLIGTHEVLEKALKRFPRQKPYDLVDAAFWSWFDLDGNPPFESAVGGASSAMQRADFNAGSVPSARSMIAGNSRWP